MPRPASSVVALVLLASVLGQSSLADGPSDDFFESKIRPLLADRCWSCHKGDDAKGGLRLDSRAAVFTGGDAGPAAEPGKPLESLLIEVIGYESEPRMPPKGKLAPAEIEALTRWVEIGMPWPGDSSQSPSTPTVRKNPSGADHWAFQPVRKVAPPAASSAAWQNNPIDAFVRAKLDAAGLEPAPEADRRTLIRRLTFDLTGLPPAPFDVEAFLADTRPDAYGRLVDRLLASPAHGEQWARHWLDVARYSDTKGYVYAREEKNWVHAWAYRDWVVNALNRDLPYDRFLALQIAADQLPDDSPDKLAAMGFLTIGRRFLGVTHDIIDDRIDVVTRGALGLTVACARCHDHKFDPIPTADYYSLYGVFQNCAEKVVRLDDSHRDDAFEQGLRERKQKLDEMLARRRSEAAGRVRARVADYLAAQLEMQNYPEEGFDQILSESDIIPTFVRRWRDHLKHSERRGDPIFAAWHAYAKLPAAEFAARSPDTTAALAQLPPEKLNPHIAREFATPPSSMREVAARYGAVLAEVEAAWRSAIDQAKAAAAPAPTALPDPALEALRGVLYGPDAPCEVPDEPIVNTEYFFPTGHTEELWKLQGEVDRWLIQNGQAPAYAITLVDRSITKDPRVFRRGNPANAGDEIPRRFLKALSPPDQPAFARGSGRLELAQAIVDPKNPLTARVIVNRLWTHHFGSGLVTTPSDFGFRAQPPSHPELLDWLAAQLVQEGWSLKAIHRLIVTSATYKQSSAASPELAAKAAQIDPDNRLHWRHNPHRLTFEETRDALLAATAGLDPTLGGKPMNPLAPPFSPRRTIYGRIDREDVPSVLRVFDFANPDLHIPQRVETTVPQQALFFLNSPFLADRARALAAVADQSAAGDAAVRIRAMFRQAYQREASPAQVERALAFVSSVTSEPSEESWPTAKEWSYGFAKFDPAAGTVTGFQPLPHFTGKAWQGGPAWPDTTLGWAQLTADGGHAGNDLDHAAVRRWVAPRDMAVRVESTLHHDEEPGDGVRGSIVSSRHGRLASSEVHHGQASMSLGRLELKAGDTIDFVLDIRGGLNSDMFRWAPVVEELPAEGAAATRWDARDDFRGPAPARLGAWEQLAQVLLMSNEFLFVD